MALAALDTRPRPRLDRLRHLFEEVTGIKLPPSKDLMIESRLRRRLIELGLPDLDAYLHHLFDEGALDAEMPVIVDILTTNKTDFFREVNHYRFLEDKLIPAALLRAGPGRRVSFKLWSAAASTGAEAWSAAMVLARAAAADPRLEWAILGTDISARVLDVAKKAIYPAAELQPVPKALRDTYVMTGREGVAARGRIVPELRARVRFAKLNLMETPYSVDGGLDLIMLRNVLIYFEPPVQHRVVSNLAAHLRPNGHLIVGHSESMTVRVAGLRQVAPSVFCKVGGH